MAMAVAVAVDVKNEIDKFLSETKRDSESIRVLIWLLVSFQLKSDSANDHLLLKPLADLFSSRNSNESDEGLWIYNLQNRRDSLFGLCHLITSLGAEGAIPYLEDVVPPMIWALGDIKPAIQYSACTALFETLKIVKGELLVYFERILQGLLGLYVIVEDDEDLPSHQKAARILDYELKDIVEWSDRFRLMSFIQLLKTHVNVQCPHSRWFLLKWISHLYNVKMLPRLLPHLPVFLDGLLNMSSVPPPLPPGNAALDQTLFKKSCRKSKVLLSRFRQMLLESHFFYSHNKLYVGDIFSIATRHLAKKSTRIEALNWMSMLITKYPSEVLQLTEFKHGLDAALPEAHYLEGVRVICQEKDFKAAKTHLFKALNHVKESTFAITMLAICSGEKELADFFSSMLYTQPWEEVVTMWDSLRTTIILVSLLQKNASSSTTLDIEIPGCAQSHNIDSKCKDCYLFWCSKEFSRLKKLKKRQLRSMNLR